MTSHPRLRTRGTPPNVVIGEVTRALCYLPDVFQETWIEAELALLRISVQVSRTVDQLICALVEDPPPRPQLLFANLGAMTPLELLKLHSIREQGWFGSVFAVGDAPLALRQSLTVERVISAPLNRGQLRSALIGSSHSARTTKISRISG